MGKIRSPGSNTSNSICNKDCDPLYTSDCATFTNTQMKDFATNIKCQTGQTKIGYNCVLNTASDISNLL